MTLSSKDIFFQKGGGRGGPEGWAPKGGGVNPRNSVAPKSRPFGLERRLQQFHEKTLKRGAERMKIVAGEGGRSGGGGSPQNLFLLSLDLMHVFF